MYNGDEVPTRFRSSRRLDVTVSVEEVLKRTGQADGAAVIKVWDPRARLVSNPAGLVSEFQPLGG